ncbi:MAG: heme ABC exporter ATP-binding protein CcmA [Amaricoccus sp.]|uniref:heme ABC exporter ATP-binding protein CcmA n=1 Tax=Amaricoccus sp. TaxID=1872485 RepID=UPI003315594B
MGLTVSDLSCLRAGRPVLRGLGFTVGDGAALLLRGPNGAGKSTLLRALAGLLAPAAGTVTLDDVTLADDPDAYAERLAYAGHLDAIKASLTVAENLRFWAALSGGGAIDGALAAFGLEAIADQPAHACSAGQKRRLGLARLLVARRRLWLLDEPTVSLDRGAVARFADVVRAHLAGGGLAIIATHVELGLGPTPALELTAPTATRAAGADPFLTGNW